MIIYTPTKYEVKLTNTEIKTIEDCREVINDIIESLTKKDCDTLETESMLFSKANLLDMSRRLQLLLEIEAMYQGEPSPFWAGPPSQKRKGKCIHLPSLRSSLPPCTPRPYSNRIGDLVHIYIPQSGEPCGGGSLSERLTATTMCLGVCPCSHPSPYVLIIAHLFIIVKGFSAFLSELCERPHRDLNPLLMWHCRVTIHSP